MEPGDFALTQIYGPVGQLIRFGQWLNGDGFHDYTHCFIYTGNGKVVEAYPGGARELNLSAYADRDLLWSSGLITLDTEQRSAIVDAAYSYLGTPYSFLDYVALASRRLGIPSPCLKYYIRNSKHMMCSQFADRCYLNADVHLFHDDRWEGYVTPGDLYRLLTDRMG